LIQIPVRLTTVYQNPALFFRSVEQFVTKKLNVMKKLLIATTSFCLLVLTTKTNAQFSRGTVMLGTTIGSAGYSAATSDYNYDAGEQREAKTNTFTFSVGPQIGFFLSPRLVAGATPSFNISTSHATNNINNTNNTFSNTTTNTTTTTVTIGPFMRYYLSSLKGNNWFYAQVNGAAGAGSGTTDGSSTSSTATGSTNGKVTNIFTWNAGGSLGLTHFFYKRIGMDVALGYNYSHVHNYDINNSTSTNKTSGNTTSSANNYTLNTATNGVTLGVGFHWFLKG
jgi:hypothetical protein